MDPGTQRALIDLLQWLFADPTTQRNLLQLLQVVFSDPALQKTVGEFLVQSLDGPVAKQMLQDQAMDLVSVTVLDKKVQEDAGIGIYEATMNALLPWRWSYWKRKATREDGKKEANQEVAVGGISVQVAPS